MTGGSPQAAVHRVAVVDGSRTRQFVLRRWMPGEPEWTAWTVSAVAAEASVLAALVTSAVPAPEVVATTDGSDGGGAPAILMTRAPGRLQLEPRRPDYWARNMAVALARIHGTQVGAPEWERWSDPQALSVPPWTRRPEIWDAAVQAAREASGGTRSFIHGDYQHFNILWRHERLTAVVDWVHASWGPPDIDVGHCRLNVAVLFSAGLAEEFRRAYETEAGRTVDPRWDITSPLSFSEGWHSGIPRQVAGRTRVDQAGMNDRVEELLTAAVARL